MCSQGSGEGLSLSLTEKEIVYRAAVDTLGGDHEIIGAGIGLTGGTDEALEQVQRLSMTGVHAIQVFPPRTGARRPHDREIERYYDEVLGAARCPVVLGENVTLVGYEIGPRLIGRLVDRHSSIEGLSYTAPGGLGQLTELVTLLRDRVQIRCGWLHHLTTMAALGGAGVLCFDGNLVPGLVAAAWTAAADGRSDLVPRLATLFAINKLLSQYGNPASIKAVLKCLGLPAGQLRRPFLGLDDVEFARLQIELNHLLETQGFETWL
jgi:4-hydroxy-tetrahydrodipicolinate synthase